MRKLVILFTLVAFLLGIAGFASAATIWTASYNWSDPSKGSTLWEFDTIAGTLVNKANFDFNYVQSVVDQPGSWMYITAWGGSSYNVFKIDKSGFAVSSSTSVSTLGIPNDSRGFTPRLSGMTYDGSGIWGMDYDGITYQLSFNASGDPTGTTSGIDILPDLVNGNVANSLLGTLAYDSSGARYLGGLENYRYPYINNSLTSGTPTQQPSYVTYDYTAASAFDNLGNWWFGEDNAANIYLGTLASNNDVSTTYDFTTELNRRNHIGFGGMANQYLQPIPEPTTMLLFGSGLIGLAGFRRKFKKS